MIAAEASEVLVVLGEQHGQHPVRRDQTDEAPVPSTTAMLDSPRLTMLQAATSWSTPGATTGGSASMTSAMRASSARRQQPLDRHDPHERVAVQHRDVVGRVEDLADERGAHVPTDCAGARPARVPSHARQRCRAGSPTGLVGHATLFRRGGCRYA